MSILAGYRRNERRFFERCIALVVRLIRAIFAAFTALIHAGRQGISILVVPASEAKPRGFRISYFGAVLVLALGALVTVSIFLFSGSIPNVSAEMSDSDGRYSAAQQELDQYRDEVARLMDVYGSFNKALGSIVDALPQSTTGQATLDSAARLGRVFGPQRSGDEKTQLATVTSTFLEAAPLIREYGATLGKMKSVQKSIPSIWPIKGGLGHISTYFGYATNDFTGQRYFHQGIDCSTYRSGDPIVATADGKVVLTANDRSYGLTIVIAHAQGFSTRYGHLDRILVRTGQFVKQGDIIGILGNTGVSTGPHIHYEVMIGDKRTDPMNFLWLRQP
jgi:murein DD-endopeptidase MepM/ murein hydrolase activator NlpD